VDWEKRLEETRLVVGLVSNSSFLNGDVEIMGLVILNFSKQIIMSSSSVYLPLYSLVHNCASALYSVMCSIVQYVLCISIFNIPTSILHISVN
jgi:hypothetical protein